VLGRRVRRSRDGAFELQIPEREREVLRSLPGQLRSLILDGDPGQDPALRRLYPTAHLDDPAAAAEFDVLVRDDLTAQRLASIQAMEGTLEADRLNEEELVAWLGTINDLRLVLGVRLAVTEESEPADYAGDPEREDAFRVYGYLSSLVEDIVEAISGD
jgi:hypothetical protein